MTPDSLHDRVHAFGRQYLRIQVASRRRARLPKEAPAGTLQEVVGHMLGAVPAGHMVKHVTLLGMSFLPDEGEEQAMVSLFEMLSSCTTISFRKCTCRPSTLLCIFRAVRAVLFKGKYNWSNLYVVPACIDAMPAEWGDAFRKEIPLLLQSLRETGLEMLNVIASFILTCFPSCPKQADFLKVIRSSVDTSYHILSSRDFSGQQALPHLLIGLQKLQTAICGHA